MTYYQYQQVRAKEVKLIHGSAPPADSQSDEPAASPVVIHGDGGLVVGGEKVGRKVYVGDYAAKKLAKQGHAVAGWPKR